MRETRGGRPADRVVPITVPPRSGGRQSTAGVDEAALGDADHMRDSEPRTTS